MVSRKVIAAIVIAALLCFVFGIVAIVNMLKASPESDADTPDTGASDDISEAQPTEPVEVYQGTGILGDVNADGVVDTADASLILEYYSFMSTTRQEEHMPMEEYIIYRKTHKKNS